MMPAEAESSLPAVLVVDDKPNMLSLLAKVLGRLARVVPAPGVGEAIACLEREPIAAVVCDLRLGDGDGLAVLRHARTSLPHVPVILMTAYATVATAVEAMREGAFDYVTKPFDPDALRAVVERALGSARVLGPAGRVGRADGDGLGRLLGRSPPMKALFRLIERVAPTSTTVLILGETGSGKELVARALHDLSARAGQPFFAVNCAAIPRSLVESELFGHAKGSFTGAVADRTGLFEAATGSTLLLDEVGDLRLSVQAKLTRVLESQAVLRIGEARERKVDVRLLAATHRDLRRMTKGGQFREDLWFRLNVCLIDMPPLRDRPDDIPLLANHFLAERGPLVNATASGFSAEAFDALVAYPWPGNVRELRSAIERAAITETTSEVRLESLPPEVRSALASPVNRPIDDDALGAKTLHEALSWARGDASRRYLEAVLRRFQGDVAASATHAGIERESFYRLMRRHGVSAEAFRAGQSEALPKSSRRGPR
ncbi:MAG TPA: sigma-54 dependent transcriptional regulator [Polyangiaceae bacterium]|nr:sigma-54 dependent transcriptional regulator [Polyangiaceae bacterium]